MSSIAVPIESAYTTSC